MRRAAVLLAALGSGVGGEASAQQGVSLWVPHLLGAQVTVIGQDLLRFPAAYSGLRSLTSSGDQAATDTYGLYLGARLPRGLEAYLDVEMARGAGIGGVVGLAATTNGDVIRQGAASLSQGPFVARGFVRYVLPLGPARDTAPRAIDQLPVAEPRARLEIKAGKFALSDDLDQNRYANAARTQFSNLVLFNNPAWDYAADTRGFSDGVEVAWVGPRAALRLAEFLMPTLANGGVLDWDLGRARGENLEFTMGPTSRGTVIRILAYQNLARMGIYAEALAAAAASGRPPDIVADDEPGRRKYGFGINAEQPLADDGDTGVFLRLGWNDGATESFVFTEVDRHFSVGLQIAGTSWRRSQDRVGVGVALDGLSADHRAYLAAGGVGFLLGDGQLTYGPERLVGAYYRLQWGRYLELTPEIQLITNPAYNRDRGPATVLSLRANLRY